MQWRHITRGLDRLSLAMVLERFGRKVHLGSGRSPAGSQYAFHIFPLVIGVGALTTLLVGSFLWGYVSGKNRKEREKSSPLNDLYPHASYKPNTVVTIREFTQPAPPPATIFTDDDNDVYFDTLVFDPEEDYAQVLAEARSHAATQRVPVTNPSMTNGSKQAWMTRSSSARRHNPFLEDLEAMFPQHQDSNFEDRLKSKSWKKLLFWKRSKKISGEFEVYGGIQSSCATPLHQSLKSSRTRATVAPTTISNGWNRKPTPRPMSGPVYSDGIPYAPNRNGGRAGSGSLSGSSTPSRDGLYESAYIPLKKSAGGYKVSSGPLYVT